MSCHPLFSELHMRSMSRAWPATLLVMVLALAALPGPANAQSTGSVTGTVTDSGTGAALADVEVRIYNASGSYIGNAWTNASGVYTTAGLAPGTYYLRTSNSLGYVDEAYNNVACPGSSCYPYTTGTGVSVAVGAATSGIDFALAAGGAITGTVTDADTGAPLASVYLYIYNASGNYVSYAYTNASGVYTTARLVPGTYYMLTWNSLGYVDELYNDLPCPGSNCYPYTAGTGVSVTAGATTGTINFGLAVGGTITGTVTDAGTGAPLSGVSVYVYNASNSSQGSVTTNASGVYTKTGLATGTHYVRTSNSLGYVDELYDDLPCVGGSCAPYTSGTGVAVTAAATTSAVDFALAQGGTITGAVTAEGTGAPLANVTVYVYNASNTSQGTVTTNAAGVYAKTGLVTGTYYLRTSNSLGYLDELYNNLPCAGGSCTATSGMGVSVTAGATTNEINFGLVLGGTITGTVTAEGTGAPLANVTVYVYNASNSSQGTVTTNASGMYTKTGLVTGTYYLRTSNSLGYLDELYNNLPCAGGSCTATSGTGVAVTAGLTTNGIDFGLPLGGTITGTVTAEGTGVPLANVTVWVYNASNSLQGGVTTNASGVYAKTGLGAGTYFVRTSNSLGYVDELYHNLLCVSDCIPYTSGTGVAVTAGATTSGVDFGLAPGGTITGTVTAEGTGAPLANVTVWVYNASNNQVSSTRTNASAIYTTPALVSGTYYVRTSNSLGYVDELYDSRLCVGDCSPYTSGTGVAVTAGATTGGVDFGLAQGGTITGTVTADGTGALLANVTVWVYNAGNSLQGTVATNASGLYTKTGLAPGTYYLRTSNSLGYVDELHNNLLCAGGSCSPYTSGTGVAVTAGATTSGVDFALAQGGTITGTVTAEGTGAPLTNVTVYVYNAANSSQGTVTTDASGVYAKGGLATGTYYVRTSNSLGYLDELYKNLPCVGGCSPYTSGTGVAVTAGATTSGVDFGLALGGTITGTVTAEGTGAPLANVTVYVYNASNSSQGTSTTNASGVYTKTGLVTGIYYVRTVSSLGYVDELYKNLPCVGDCYPYTSGTGVTVTAGAMTSGVDFGLALGGTIAGTVTDAATGAPLANVTVSVSNAGNSSVGSSVTTNASGVYTKTGLGTGAYFVRTSNGLGYLDELYDNLSCVGGSCTATSGTGVAVTAGATTGGVNFSLALGGTITGTVRDGSTGAPLAGVQVVVYNASNSSLGSVTTNASGVYAKVGLATGTYYVRTSNSLGYVDEVYKKLSCAGGNCSPYTSGTSVAVTAGATASGVDFGLAIGGTISGTVTDAGTGAPLVNVTVWFYNAGNSSQGSVTTNAWGLYAKTGLATGPYFVRTSNSLGYVDELYDNLACAGDCSPYTLGTGVAVTAGATTSGVDFGLAPGGTITGTVTAEGTGAPLANVTVWVYNASNISQGTVTTNAWGLYAKTGLTTGTYYVRTSNGLGYLDELYNDRPCPGGACTMTSGTGVAVTAGAATSGVDFGLALGGTIAGTVTAEGTGAPLANVTVYVYNASNSSQGTSTTNASGVYTKTGLVTGIYYVRTVNSLGYVDELYNNLPCVGDCYPYTSGTGAAVTAGATTNGIDFGLTVGGSITGTVTDAGTGAPLANVTVQVYNAGNSSVGSSVATNASGMYTKTGLGTGTYYLRTSNGLGYVDELYNNFSCVGGSCTATSGTGVAVTAGATTSGVDVGLALGGTIAGTVTDAATGAPLANVTVSVYNASNNSVGTSVTTNASGVYAKTGLGTGVYYVRTSNSLGYVDELYHNLLCVSGCSPYTSGTGVAVAAGATTNGVDFGLALGGTITGMVRDTGTGAPLANVTVQVYSTSNTSMGSVTTNAWGVYAKAGLATGTYYVRTSNSLGYVDELYDNLPCASDCSTYTSGTGVAVTAGMTTSGVDFGLARGGTITGTVTDAGTGAPLANVTVQMWNASGTYAWSNTTNTLGVYTRTGLAPGTYYVRTSNSLGYVDELYDNLPCAGGSCTATSGTGVTVTAGATASGIDFGLALGGTITGTVTDAGTAAPLANVTVFVYNASNTSQGTVTTNASGVYTKGGLATGTYYVRTSNSLGYLDELYHNIPCAGGSCSPYTSGTGVVVTAGATTSGVDVGLAPGGTIAGTVTAEGTGAPLANVTVQVYNASNTSQGSVTTNASGVYTKTGLITGTYYVRTSNSLGYVDELYNDVPCAGGSCTATSGTGVAVTAGATAGGVDFGLALGGSITGTVTDAITAAPLANVTLFVHNASNTSQGSVSTNASGVYTKTGLITGTYYVRTSNSLGYLDELYHNVPCVGGNCSPYTSGTGVAVTAGATASGVDFGLALGGSITGVVTDAGTGAPLANVTVQVYNASNTSQGSVTTNAWGVYAKGGLATGTHYVRTSNGLGYVDELYNNFSCVGGSCTATSGTGVAVTAGATTSGVDVGLALGGTIAGTVTDAATGAPLANVTVSVYNASNSSVGTTVTTNASGAYAKTGLGTGVYYVRTSNSLGYVDELYHNLLCVGGCSPYTSGTGVLVTAGATTSGIDFGLALGGTVTGTVRDTGTGAPLANVTVQVYSTSNTSMGSVTTNAWGVYAKAGLATGTYYVRTSNSLGYVDELYDNLPCASDCSMYTSGTGVAVTAGMTTSGVDFGLARGGTITGTVTDAGTGAPLANVTVQVYSASNTSLGSVTANAWGVYEKTGLATGTYYVRTSNSLGYVDELYDNLSCVGGNCSPYTSGTGVAVTAGATASGIDFGLALGGTITGTVTDAGTAAPLANVTVYVYNASNSSQGTVTTNASGVYTKGGLATGTYYVRTSNSLGYLDELYDNLSCAGGNCSPYTAGTGVAVTAGATTSGVDFGLALGGTIAGTVTAEGSGAPLANVSVQVYNAGNSSQGSVTTNASGVYAKTGLITGTYYVRTSNSLGYVDELYNDVPCVGGSCTATSGTGVTVTAGATTSGVDFGLALGGSITGTVTDAGTAAPLANVTVFVYNTGNTSQGTVTTNVSGAYTKTGLITGTYYVRTSNSLGYLDELYHNIPCAGGNCSPYTSGTDVAVTAGTTRSGVDFGLALGGTITGVVTDAGTGAPLANVTVQVYNASNASQGSVTTNAWGVYAKGGLATGTHYVRTSNGLGYVDELYNNLSCVGSSCTATSGTGVAVTAGTTTSGVDVGLAFGGTIAGTVTDAATGAPLPGVSVNVYNTSGSYVAAGYTNALGVYTATGLGAGTYYVQTSNALGYVDELYNNLSCVGGSCTATSGTGVAVTAGATTGGVNVSLALGGTITGTVRDAGTGAPLANVTVQVYNASNTSQGSVTTNAWGVYAKGGLATGTHYVRTSNSLGYMDELYNDLPCVGNCSPYTSGTGVAVTAGATTSGTDFGLAPGGKITGTVTAAGAGVPLASVTVSVYNAAGTSLRSASTNALGAYTVTGLGTGTYYVRTSNSLGYQDEIYNDVPCMGTSCTVTTGSSVAVTTGATTSGIDFGLAPGGKITGTVTDASKGTPLAGVSVRVYDVGGSSYTSVTTNGLGVYTLSGLATGTRYVRTSNSLGYLDELYNNLPCPGGVCTVTNGTPVSATAETTTSGVDFGLVEGAIVTGTVTDASTGAPLAGVLVNAYTSSGSSAGTGGTTDASGVYAVRALPTGTFFLRTSNSLGYIDEIHDNNTSLGTAIASGTPVVVTSVPSTLSVNFALNTGGRISGLVTDEATGQPIPNVTITVSSATGSAGSATTGADGRFVAPGAGLPTGTYFVRTTNSAGYVNELFDNLVTVASPVVGTPIAVTQPAITPDINIALAKGGTITGTVTNALSGAPLPNVRVALYYANSVTSAPPVPATGAGTYAVPGYVTSAVSDGAGVYALTGLAPGDFLVRTVNAFGYLDEIFHDTVCLNCDVSAGQVVSVASAGSITAAIDFALTPAATATHDACTDAVVIATTPFTHVSSTTLAAGSADEPNPSCGSGPKQSVWYRFTPASDGVLKMKARGSNYDTVISVYTGSCGAFTEEPKGCFDDSFSSTGSSLDVRSLTVPVKAGTTYAIQVSAWSYVGGTLVFSLDFLPTGTVSGHVLTDVGATPVEGTIVSLYDATGVVAGTGTTDATGAYQVDSLMVGVYFAVTLNDLGYVDTVYGMDRCVPTLDRVCNPLLGQPVVVTAGATAAVDFLLTPGGRVSGTVIDAVTSVPVANVDVRIVDTDGTLRGRGRTDASGVYVTGHGLPAGTYYAVTSNSAGFSDQAYKGAAICLGLPGCTLTPVTIAAGVTTTGIDFALVRGSQVLGVALDDQTGWPLTGVTVTFFDDAGNSATATTSTNGSFATSKRLPAGAYRAFTENTIGYIDQRLETASVVVQDSAPTTGVVFRLARGARIAGSVAEEGTSAPIGGVEVQLFAADGTSVGSAVTGTDGTYRTPHGVPPGTYVARTNPSRTFAAELFRDKALASGLRPASDGDPIFVIGNRDATGVDFSPARCAAPLTLGPAVLPHAPAKTAYSQALTAAGGAAPYGFFTPGPALTTSFRLDGGPGFVGPLLPPGLTLDSVAGQIAGTPTLAGQYAFAIGAVDAAGCGATRLYQLSVGDTPVVTWAAPASVVLGTALSGAQLNATANVAGTFVYTPPAGTVLPTGTHTLSVTFTPGDPGSYTPATASVSLLVTPAPAVVTWANPASIVYGTALSASQLNATANVAGTFVYTPAPGTVLNAGAGQVLSVTFTPTDTLNYTTATKTVTIDVTKAAPVVTWANPAAITAGTALGATQLNATASVPGTFVYTPPAGTVLGAGVGQTLSVTFTPTDAVNYSSVTKTVLIDVSSLGGPVITDVAPASGAIGSGVTVTGTGFTGATAVTFHGVPAAYAVVSDTLVTTTVPAGTTTGPVRVATPGGTATSATDFVVTNQRATRTLPGCYVAGYGVTVSIDVGPAPEVLQHALADTPPAGWTVGTISDSGVWDAPASQVNWGPFFDATARVLTYVVTPPAETTGAVTFAGVARFDGVEVPLGGTTTLSRCEQHPADANSDFRMVIGEVTGYGAAWKKGNTWAVPPVPIPIGYVTRAGYLWRVGETYRRDAGACPVCWMPLTAVPLPVPDGFLSIEDIPTPRGGPWSAESSDIVRSPGASLRLASARGARSLRLRSGQAGWADTGASAVRQAPATYVPTVPLTVTLTVTPDGDVQSWALEETVPAGWQVNSVSADGYWDEKAGVVRWGPFFDETPQTLRYTLTPPTGASGPQDLRGTASFDGVDVAVTGVRTLQRAPITRPGGPGK